MKKYNISGFVRASLSSELLFSLQKGVIHSERYLDIHKSATHSAIGFYAGVVATIRDDDLEEIKECFRDGETWIEVIKE